MHVYQHMKFHGLELLMLLHAILFLTSSWQMLGLVVESHSAQWARLARAGGVAWQQWGGNSPLPVGGARQTSQLHLLYFASPLAVYVTLWINIWPMREANHYIIEMVSFSQWPVVNLNICYTVNDLCSTVYYRTTGISYKGLSSPWRRWEGMQCTQTSKS